MVKSAQKVKPEFHEVITLLIMGKKAKFFEGCGFSADDAQYAGLAIAAILMQCRGIPATAYEKIARAWVGRLNNEVPPFSLSLQACVAIFKEFEKNEANKPLLHEAIEMFLRHEYDYLLGKLRFDLVPFQWAVPALLYSYDIPEEGLAPIITRFFETIEFNHPEVVLRKFFSAIAMIVIGTGTEEQIENKVSELIEKSKGEVGESEGRRLLRQLVAFEHIRQTVESIA